MLAIVALEEPEPRREFIEEEQKPGDGFLGVPRQLVNEAVKP